MNTLYNSYDIRFKNPFGAVKQGEKISFTIRLEEDTGFITEPEIMFCNYRDWLNTINIPMKYEKTEDGYNYFSVQCSFDKIGIKYYSFRFKVNDKIKYLKRDSRNQEAYISEDGRGMHWQVTIYSKRLEMPKQFVGKAAIQIFVDRYARTSVQKNEVPYDRIIHENWYELPIWKPNEKGKVLNNDYFGGDLQGITKYLKYIKRLGIDILYLTPIWEAHSNHGYDTADYKKVDPLKGTLNDLKKLIRKAHKMGMLVILDTVLSHTGADSIYFNRYNRYDSVGAFNSKESPFFIWYTSIQGEKYKCWWGFDNLPELNKNNLEYRKFLFDKNGVIDFWCSLGIDGLRIDVADEFPEDFLLELRACLDRNENKYNKQYYIVGEVWENAVRKEKDGYQRHYILNRAMCSVMNYPAGNAILNYIRYGNYNNLYNEIMEQQEDYPIQTKNMFLNSISTHDSVRAITKLVQEELGSHDGDRNFQFEKDKLDKKLYKKGKKLLKLASVFQYFYTGIPCLYYGDETGIAGYKDPFNRKPYPWKRRDKELVKFFMRLGNTRKNALLLPDGYFIFVQLDDKVCVFKRNTQIGEVYICINRSEEIVELAKEVSGVAIIGEKNVELDELKNILKLKELGYVVIKKRR